MRKRKINKYLAYPPNWKTERVPAIKLRAHDKCEFCGVDNRLIGYRDRHGAFVDLTAHRNVFFDGQRTKVRVSWRNEITLLWKKLPNDATLIRIVITTAHLDHDPENWQVSDERLRALCQRCHLNNDRSHNIRKRKYGAYHKQPQLF